jgi:hypothetical protein
MSRSYWGYVLAAVIGLGVIASSVGYYEVDQATRAKYPGDHYQPARDASLPKFMPGKPQPKKYDPNCQQPQNATDADLCAQWGAVKAVDESNRLVRVGILLSFILGAIGVIATAIGTILVYRSLMQTREGIEAARAANKIAEDGLIEARAGAKEQAESVGEQLRIAARNADAALSANALMEQSLKNEYRPWLDFDIRIVGATLGALNLEISYEITIRNMGKSPALKVTYASEGVQAYDIPSDYHRQHIYDVGVEVPDRAAALQRQLHSPSIMPNGQHVITDTAYWHRDKINPRPMGSEGEIFPMICIGVWYQWAGEPEGHVTGHYFKIISHEMPNKSVLVSNLENGDISALYVEKIAPNKIT